MIGMIVLDSFIGCLLISFSIMICSLAIERSLRQIADAIERLAKSRG